MKLRRTLLLHVVLIVGAVLTLTPLLWMVAASFMAPGEANQVPPRILPAAPTLEHYRALFERLDLARNFVNSFVVALIGTTVGVTLNAMAGYAFAKLRFPGREGLFRTLVAAMVIPAQVSMVPLFLMLQQLGLINTLMGVALPSFASIFGIFMVRQFALAIPDDLIDAARLDGASEWRIFWTIVMPVLQPVLVTLGLFIFLSSWNDFMWPLIVLSDSSRYTLPVAIANLVGEHVQDTELMMASAVLTVLPVLTLFLALQRFYTRGILAGSLKD